MGKRVIISLENIAKAYCKICPYCNRKVPNWNFFTKDKDNNWCNSCRWCDSSYHMRKNNV